MDRGDHRRSRTHGADALDRVIDEQQVFSDALSANYRQLVLNYEARREYEAAEDFYIGEMETHRKRIAAEAWAGWRIWPSIRRIVNSYGAYLVLSRYGSSYWQLLGMLLVIVMLFGAGFMSLGFRETKEGAEATAAPILPVGSTGTGASPPAIVGPNVSTERSAIAVPQRRIRYEWVLPSLSISDWGVGISQFLSDLGHALLFVLSIATFQKDRFYEPVSPGGQLLLYVAVVVITGQAALIFFAIRRRFKR